MRIFFKLVILAALTFVTLWNYRIFTIEGGLSDTLANKNWTTQITTLASVEKIEYYEKTISSENAKYKVYLVANGKGYLMDATEDDLTAIALLGGISSKYIPQKIFVLPFYVELIIGFIILIIPFGKKKKKQTE